MSFDEKWVFEKKDCRLDSKVGKTISQKIDEHAKKLGCNRSNAALDLIARGLGLRNNYDRTNTKI